MWIGGGRGRSRPKVVTVPAKQQQRESRREAKAEVAARLDRAIEAELLERLKSGTYGDIYNFPTKQYEKVVAMEEMEVSGGPCEWQSLEGKGD